MYNKHIASANSHLEEHKYIFIIIKIIMLFIAQRC
jgi:hypothetical protein